MIEFSSVTAFGLVRRLGAVHIESASELQSNSLKIWQDGSIRLLYFDQWLEDLVDALDHHVAAFHLRLPGGRNINMVRIHLNTEAAHEPERVPRCHLHVGDSRAHVPFPIMNPLLTLYLICEHIEPDFGLNAEG